MTKCHRGIIVQFSLEQHWVFKYDTVVLYYLFVPNGGLQLITLYKHFLIR